MLTETSSEAHDLRLFFLIAFAWSWLLHLSRLLDTAGWLDLPYGVSPILGNLAVIGPAVAAFVLTGLLAGKTGMRELWRRGWEIRFRKIWLLPALLLMPTSGLLTLVLLTALGKPVAWEYALPPAMIVPIGLLIWLGGALPEEYGWRGYALDRLQSRMNPTLASLALGLIWSVWHLPLHYIPGTTQAAIPIGEFAIQTVVLSVLYTWLHNHTGGSVLVASLFHSAGNLTGALLPTWTLPIGRWLSLLPLLFMTVIVIWKGGLRRPQG